MTEEIDQRVAAFLAGEWISVEEVESNPELRARLREYPITYSTAKRAVQFKSDWVSVFNK